MFSTTDAFGINFDANPIELSLQLIAAIPLMADPFHWMLWGALLFVLYCNGYMQLIIVIYLVI